MTRRPSPWPLCSTTCVAASRQGPPARHSPAMTCSGQLAGFPLLHAHQLNRTGKCVVSISLLSLPLLERSVCRAACNRQATREHSRPAVHRHVTGRILLQTGTPLCQHGQRMLCSAGGAVRRDLSVRSVCHRGGGLHGGCTVPTVWRPIPCWRALSSPTGPSTPPWPMPSACCSMVAARCTTPPPMLTSQVSLPAGLCCMRDLLRRAPSACSAI